MQGGALSCLPVLLLNQDEDLGQGQETGQSSLMFQTTHQVTSGTSSIIPLQQQVNIRTKRVRPRSPEYPEIQVDGEQKEASSPAQHISHNNAACLNVGSGGEEQVRDSTCAHT